MLTRVSLSLFVLVLLGFSFQAKADKSQQQVVDNFNKYVKDCYQTMDKDDIESINKIQEFVRTSVGNTVFDNNVVLAMKDFDVDEVERGIDRMLYQRKQRYENTRSGKALLEEHFEKQVKRVCDTMIQKLEPIKEDYEYISEHKGSLGLMETESIDWFTNTKICLMVLKDPKTLKNKLFKRGVGQRFHTTGVGRLMHKLGPYVVP